MEKLFKKREKELPQKLTFWQFSVTYSPGLLVLAFQLHNKNKVSENCMVLTKTL